MNKNSDTNLTLKFFLNCEMNVQLNKINEAYKELGLLKHWALEFETMNIFVKNEVIREINKRANESDFYDCLAPISEESKQ